MGGKHIPYGKQSISDADIEAVVQVLRGDFLTQGPKIAEFEKVFAKYVDAKYAVAVSSGTAALHLANLALGVSKGDRVITTPLTFAASANASRYVGADVAFVDIDKESLCIDVLKVQKLLMSHPKNHFVGITAVDFAGFPVDMSGLRKVADEHGLWIIEDACHAPGAYFFDECDNKQLCGNGEFSELSVFSFHPVKHIATGEGGMITTNDEALYEKLCSYRAHGITKDVNALEENHGGWYYEMHELGYNYRMTDIQAALGISQLSRASDGLERRKKLARQYNKAFADVEVGITESNKFLGHAFHLYIIQVNDRKGLYDYLRTKNIYAQVHYAPVHLMPYYKKLGWKKNDFPIVESYYDKCLSLPMYPGLSDGEQEYVINCVLNFIDTQ